MTVFSEKSLSQTLSLSQSPGRKSHMNGPSRARPLFGEVLGPEHRPLSRQLRMHPELIGEVVEIIDSSTETNS